MAVVQYRAIVLMA